MGMRKLKIEKLKTMEQPDGHKWNLVIFEPFKKHCYLEGCYDEFEDARKKAESICGTPREPRVRTYKIMTEEEYIQFRNPYY